MFFGVSAKSKKEKSKTLRSLRLCGEQFLLKTLLGVLLTEKGELGTAKKDVAEIERKLKALIKSLENKHLNPWTLFSN